MKSKRVLIVEDEAPLAHALALKLEHEGFQVVLADSGKTCLEILAKQQFDVVLLDLIMPIIDGFQVLQSMKTMSRPPVTFALSNLSQQEDETRALELGAKNFFVKSKRSVKSVVPKKPVFWTLRISKPPTMTETTLVAAFCLVTLLLLGIVCRYYL